MKASISTIRNKSRLSDGTEIKYKPMLEVDRNLILLNKLKICSSYFLNYFIICYSFEIYLIKEYLANYFLNTSDTTIDVKDYEIEVHYQRLKHLKLWI